MGVKKLKLIIIVKDSSWEVIYETAKRMKYWNDIQLFDPNNIILKKDNVKLIFQEDEIDKTNSLLVIASYNPKDRKKEYDFFKSKKYKFGKVIDPDNFIFEKTKIGEGCIICKGVIIYPDSEVNNNVLLMPYSSISHDFFVGNHSVLMEKVTTGGHGRINDNSFINSMSVIKEKIIIGSNVYIDSGSVVLKNVDDNEEVCGNPARKVQR